MTATEWDDHVVTETRYLPAVATSSQVPAATTLDLAPRAWKLAQRIAATPFAPKGLAGKPESILAAMLAGNELGLPLMTSLSKIHVVDGRPGLAAETMRALVLAAGHELWVESKSNTAVTVGGKRHGSSREQKVTWTLDDAKSAGLAHKDNWKQYPRSMLTARAMAELCRDLFPDVIGGLYAVEELQDGFDFEEPVIEAASAEAPTRKAVSPAARKRATTRARAAAGAGPEPAPPPLPDDDEPVDAVIVEDDEAPALPDDETTPDAEVVDHPAVAKSQRAQRIAMAARELDLDRALVISAVTGGTKTSGRDLTEGEGDLVLEALRRLKVGEVRLEEIDGQPQLVDSPETPNEAAEGDDEVVQGELIDVAALDDPGDGLAWRALIKRQGHTLADTIREAARLAHELEVPAPTDATAISQADDRVKAGLLTWLAEGS